MLAAFHEPSERSNPQVDAVRGQLANQPVPTRRRVAEFERLDRRARKSAALDVSTRARALGPQAQRALKKRSRQLVCGVDLLFFSANPGRFGRLVGERYRGPSREHARGFGERHVFEKLHELDRVAALTAAEALEEAAIGVNVERRRVLGVKRTESDEVVAALAQLHVRPDQLADVRPGENFANRRLFELHRLLVFATRRATLAAGKPKAYTRPDAAAA